MKKKLVWILQAVCIGVSGLVALYMLVQRFSFLSNGFQYDELYSAVTASPFLPLGFIWKEMLLQDINLPLFNILLYGWNHLFPYTKEWMHLFSALLGVASVGVAWFLAPKSWAKLPRYMLCTLLCSSFVLVAYGAIARTYSLFILLTVIFTLLALRLVETMARHHAPATGLWVWFFVSGLLGAYSHYFCAGVFFITALLVFLYACYYKKGRGWAFWGTAAVFGLWSVWTVRALLWQGSGGWWYAVPTPKAVWEIFTFLLGPHTQQAFVLLVTTLSLVSLVSTYKKKFWLKPEVVIPLGQIVLLVGTVAFLSHWYNLWMDRYFLALMPGICVLLVVFISHLADRHRVLLVLWPVLVSWWAFYFMSFDYLRMKEYTGFEAAFDYLAAKDAHHILVDETNLGYPRAAVKHMIAFHVPKGYEMDIKPFTRETAPLALQEPRPYIMMPLCSQVHLIYTSLQTGVEEEQPLAVFNNTCVFYGKPVDFAPGRGPMSIQEIMEIDLSQASQMPGQVSLSSNEVL